ncbi:uncharacterized protein LOC105277347 [Ooceraea biroi]|nr:uncharacterized protein LOC105277347 [Ooceraea biroi]
MICVYCDNPQDKCACRAPIGKCSLCGLSSDVCDCQNGGGDDSSRKRVVGEPYESRTIQVTSWKPKREIRRYFARDPADLRSDSTEECRCCERLKWQRPEELPYQRLNVFSDVMSELQQKMSESIYCTRCRRNPCRCGSQVDQDERVEGRKANGYVRCPEVEKSPRSEPSRSKSPRSKSRKSKSPRNTSPSNCRCNSSPGNERKSTVKKSAPIRRVGCVCKQSPCGCRKGRLSHRRPLAKCYYCKNLPCICIIPR